MSSKQPHELDLTHAGGSLDLFGDNEVDGVEFSLHALADGTDWGNPESVRRALRSSISQGSVSITERYDNRTIPLRVMVSASDGVALAAGERALMLASGRGAQLTWTPPADMAAPCVFVVVNSDLKFEFNDTRDHVERVYVLTLEALPNTRSVTPVTIEALPPFVAVPSVLDDCTSTTGWSSVAGDATFAIASGAVEVSAPGALLLTTVVPTLVKTFARSKRYLGVEYELVSGRGLGYPPRPVASVRTSLGGWTTPLLAGVEGKWAFFDLPASLGSILEIRFAFYPPQSGGTSVLVRILTIAESDTPAATAGRQSLRVIPTPGSARADGSLLVQSRNADDTGAGDGLGQVIVYTGPQYDPRLSVGRADTVAGDAAAMTGKCSTDTAHTFYRRASEFPTGSYGVWIHAKVATPGDVTWTLTLDAINLSNLDSVAALQTISGTATFVGTGYNLLQVGTLDLPGLAANADSLLGLRFLLTTSATTSVDEVLVFNHTSGALTVIDTRAILGVTESPPGTFNTVSGASRVWLDAPTLESSGGVVAGRGTRAGNLPASLATHLRAWDGSHPFTPDATFLYVGTTDAPDPKVTGTFPPAWHTHPVE